MKNIFSFLFLLASLSVNAQNMLVHYDFSTSYGNTVPDISGNGNNGTLFGGAHIHEDVSGNGGFLHVGYTDSDYMSIPAEVLDGLTDFTIRIKVKTWFINDGSQTSMNTIFSASNTSCINCFGLSYRYSDATWLLSFDGSTYFLPSFTFCNGELKILRHNDSLWCLTAFPCPYNKDTFFIVGNSPLNVSSIVVGQRANCYQGCFKVKQALHGGLNNLKIWDYPKFKEADQFNSEEILSLFPNPASLSLNENRPRILGGDFHSLKKTNSP
ncbi:MAG: hypothetical protein LH473_02550 [Chitinophagales bacterium]|nr:hypothetical protein [Chitinophagales bacterium]